MFRRKENKHLLLRNVFYEDRSFTNNLEDDLIDKIPAVTHFKIMLHVFELSELGCLVLVLKC